MAGATAVLASADFLKQVVRHFHDEGPSAPARETIRQRGQMLQIAYGRPTLHYEVWLQPGRCRVEVGLHFEADAALNGWLLRRFGDEMCEVADVLGEDVELEQWTSSWGRLHRYVGYDRLDDALARKVSSRLVRLVACLEPRLERFLREWEALPRAAQV